MQDCNSTQNKLNLKNSGVSNNSWIYNNTEWIDKIYSGWKFYIPVTPEILQETIKRIEPIFNKFNITYKYPSNNKVLVKINLGSFGWSQIGKNIVFYMPKIDVKLLAELSVILIDKKKSYPKVHHAIELINGIPIYYRYGNYHNLDKNDNRYIYDKKTIDKSIINDLKSILNIDNKVDKEIDSFLIDYPVFDILTQSGKGGVFKSIDLSKDIFTEVIVKVGYNIGGVQENGIDGKSLLINEYNFINKLNLKKLTSFRIPEILDFKVNKNSSIVYKFIDGISGMNKYLDNTLSLDEINDCFCAIIELHQNGIIWGDAKIGNFIWDKNGYLNMIDFELSHSADKARICELRTFNIIDIPNNISAENYDIIDFLVSILFEHNIDRQSEIQIKNLLKKTYSSSVKTECQKRLKEIILKTEK